MFKVDFVDVVFDESRNAVWKFGGRNVGGVEYIYFVTDRNYLQRNQWSFVVRVPNVSKRYMEVRPILVPNRKIWAGLERRSLQFRRGNLGKYRKKLYAKLAISDVREEKTKVILTEDGSAFPKWLKVFKPVPKRRVARTKAHDDGNLVSVIDLENHRDMIRLFLALKPWVLDDGFTPKAAQTAAKAQRQWNKSIRDRRSLKNLHVVVTGALSQGTRPKVLEWLRFLGAHTQSRINQKTDLLILGPHYLGDDRVKIKAAKRMNVKTMTEGTFYRTYLN
jgi:hypothetical protein